MRTIKLTVLAVATALGLGVSVASADIVIRANVTTHSQRAHVPQNTRYVWVEGHWAQQGHRWVWVEGYWHDRYPPAPTRTAPVYSQPAYSQPGYYPAPVYSEPVYSPTYDAGNVYTTGGSTYYVEQPTRRRPGWRWVPGHWEQRAHMRVWVDGHWVKARRDRGAWRRY